FVGNWSPLLSAGIGVVVIAFLSWRMMFLLGGIGMLLAWSLSGDLVDYREETFARIREDYLTFAEQLPGDLDIRFVPLSALEGDN
ncbi:hypothetical protein MJL79_30160, partial [Salmonella enterica subsp. enterica serovar Montevideo]|nr:hypothetical protein [Salmonella enterica subsp. enterica serovar Montevideo]